MVIYVATKVRGIFKGLFQSPNIEAKFVLAGHYYDSTTNSPVMKLADKLYKSKLFDSLGIIQRIKVSGKECDMYWSYNRFLDCDKPYILYVEHPVALYHYRLARGKSFIGQRKLLKYLSDPHLKAIVYQAEFTKKTFEGLCGSFDGVKRQIYPIITPNAFANEEIIRQRCSNSKLKLLYVAQGVRFISKGALEVLSAFDKLNKLGYNNIELTILTNLDVIDHSVIQDYKGLAGIRWLDYKLSSEQMEKLYAESSALVLVSSDDSLNAVAMEALQAGLPMITSNMSGFGEIVQEGINGYMTDPKWDFFSKDFTPNPVVWNNRSKTIYSTDHVSERIVNFITDKVIELYNNRELLLKLSLASWEMAHRAPFKAEYIEAQWNQLLYEVNQ